MGDYLCGQVHRWLKRNSDYKANGKDNIEIAFMYSQCGEDWKQVGIKKFDVNEASFNFLLSPDIQIGRQVESSISGPLKPKEPLCCTNQGKFRRCDGSAFQATCGN